MSVPPSQFEDGSAPETPDVEWIRGRGGGRYEVVRVLPAGGMAEAFVAMRHGLGGFVFPCCIKRMLGTDREQFLQEANILGKLSHDRIVRAFEVDEDEDGVCFIAMELVDGVNLGQLLSYFRRRCRRMPADLAIYVADQVLEALGHAHHREVDGQALHIVHRDVTPSNILLGRDGYVKLADFGIARFRARPDFTRTGTAKGKGPYMSPEHYDRRRGLDHRSDLFSLGATLYEMLAGERAFTTLTEEETLYAVLHGQFLPLLELAPRVDPELAELVHALLDPDKTKRPHDAAEVRERLRPFAGGIGDHAQLSGEVEACITLEQATGRRVERGRGGKGRDSSVVPDPVTTTSETALVLTGDTEEMVIATPPPLPLAARQSVAGASGRSGDAQTAPTSRRPAFVAAVAMMGVVATVVFMSRSAERALAPPAVTVATQADASAGETASHAVASLLPPETPPTEPPEGTAVPPADRLSSEAPAPDKVGGLRDSGTRRERAKTGALLVKVRAPLGFAWVDGRRRGRAPVLVKELAPGPHEVGASSDDHTPPQKTRLVDVTAGQQAEVEVVLVDMFK